MSVHSNVRSTAFMVREWARLNVHRRHRRLSRTVRHHLAFESDLPNTPGGIWAVTVVKDEVDILHHSVHHMLEQGVDVVLVADNGSTDGTVDLIRQMARQAPVVHMSDSLAAHHHGVKMTELGRIAGRAGAQWVIPFDADEFWFARDVGVADRLRNSDAGKDYASIHNMFPTSDRIDCSISIHDVYRFDLSAHAQQKVAYRTHPLATVSYGNHHVVRAGPRESGLYIAHVPWRSFDQMKRKAQGGWAATRLIGEDAGKVNGHWRHLAELDEDQLRLTWAHVVAGEGDERIGWSPVGPFVHATPLIWRTWTPETPAH